MRSIWAILAMPLLASWVLGDSSCTNPPNSWRIKRRLKLNWHEAKEAFEEVFKSPYNAKFPSNVDKNLEEFKIISESEFVIKFLGPVPNSPITESIFDYKWQATCASARAEIKGVIIPEGVKLNVGWFHAISKDEEEEVDYYFGFKSCKPERPMGADFVNNFCNEVIVGEFLHTNAKRWACILDNYKKDDALEMCKDVEAILSAKQAVEEMRKRGEKQKGEL